MDFEIIDNLKIKLIDVLKEKLSNSKKTRFCVGWLFLSGFKELREEIDKLEKLEILAGSKTDKQTAEIIMLDKKRYDIVKEILESKKFLNEEERQKILEEDFKILINELSYIKPTKENIDFLNWFLRKLKEKKIEIRIYYKQPLHAKLYLFEYKNNKKEAIVGSSNFSFSGFQINTELNILINKQDKKNKKQDKIDFLNQWFENLWEDSKLAEFTELTQKAIENCWAFNKEVTPFRIYLKVLHEIFAYKEERDVELDVELYDFQKDAVIQAYRKLNEFNGVFISDVPGLGKTYIGSALLSHLETEGKKGIVICPPRLVNYWEEVIRDFGSKAKVFSSGKLDDILNNEKYLKRQVVLIDESHHFRNPNTIKYKNMQKICENKQVILLSATPQNLNIWDIYWQIKLFTPYEANHNFRIYPIELKKYFELCENYKIKIDDLISQIFIRRTRSDIKKYYPNQKVYFPQREGPYRVDYSIDEVYEGELYKNIENEINRLNYARYDLGKYAKAEEFDPEEFHRLDIASENLQKLVRINLYRRLESSVKAFKDTLENNLRIHKIFLKVLEERNKIFVGNIDKIEDLRAIDIDYINTKESNEFIDLSIENIESDFDNKDFKLYDSTKFDIKKLKKDLEEDIEIFNNLLKFVSKITPEQDDKLQKLIEILNKEPIKNKKIIIFSSFESTVKYLFENLNNKFQKVDYIYGGEKFLNKVYKFAPKANGNRNIKPNDEIKILISTEVLSEGLNLQDGQVIINYDLHWNPVRIIQRIGRIDRIGSQNDKIYVYNFFPETKAEKNIKIEDKIRRRIKEIIQNFGYDEKVIDLNQEVITKKLFEIYTQKSEVLEEEIANDSLFKYFEFEFEKLKNKYKEEYEKAINLPLMVNVGRNYEKKGIIVFCRSDDYFRLRMSDLEGKIISYDDSEILKFLECDINEKGRHFNVNYFHFIENIREEFEKEVNIREQDKKNYMSPIKKEFDKFIKKLKKKESSIIKSRFEDLLNFVIRKKLNYESEEKIRKIIRNYQNKFGLNKKEILEKLEKEIYSILKDSSDEFNFEISKKYAQVIVAEELF